MPYIDKYQRAEIERFIDWIGLGEDGCFNYPGNLNYIISSMVAEYINVNGKSYEHYNDVIGVLECVKQELYRRKISKYEDNKIEENGDVF